MTENEAFIRAIVDSPGDDLPRLVYADRLDDRADPRGPYLRAEREAVETGDIARLRALAAGLYPVWVARVSRPPMGVCCDHVRIENRGPVVTSADIDAVEQRLADLQANARGRIRDYLTRANEPDEPDVPELVEFAERLAACQAYRFPNQLRAFLLNYNGGRPSPGHVPGVRTRGGASIAVWVESFLAARATAVDHDPATDLETFAEFAWQPDQEDIWEHTLRRLRIASTDGYEGGLWVVLDGPEAGRIEFTGHDQDWDQVSILAPSLADLLALLTDGTQQT